MHTKIDDLRTRQISETTSICTATVLPLHEVNQKSGQSGQLYCISDPLRTRRQRIPSNFAQSIIISSKCLHFWTFGAEQEGGTAAAKQSFPPQGHQHHQPEIQMILQWWKRLSCAGLLQLPYVRSLMALPQARGLCWLLPQARGLCGWPKDLLTFISSISLPV